MLGEIIAILAVLTFVVSSVLFRKTEHEASPTFINFFRTAVGTLTFILLAIFLNRFNLIFQIPWELWLILILSFVFGQVMGDTAYFSAQKELGTTIALAISMTFPLFTFILSLIFLDRAFKLNLLLSMLLIGVGITIIGKSKANAENTKEMENNPKPNTSKIRFSEILSRNIVKSIIYCFTAAFGWAVGAVMIEFATIKIDQIIQAQELSSIIGNVIRFPFALLILGSMVGRENYLKKDQDSNAKQKKSIKTLGLLLGASIIGTSLGSYLYTESVHVAGADVVALIASAAPLFALPLTYLINKETISKYGFIGVMLTIFGVLLILI
ncbi:MAG: DMT family transporter [Candidatus Lokiarchaeota archaeon]|nr:DMT family transporter [Candidatus Lokiarchaeota archaeon]